jgi:hypothetical protein
MSPEKKTLEIYFHAHLTRMSQLMTFGELSSYVNSTGTCSMGVEAKRAATSQDCPASF